MFHTPLSHLLTPYTSDLISKLSAEEWDSLGGGWSKLILVMMYETERGTESRWSSYLGMSFHYRLIAWWWLIDDVESMPREFSTPMFWSEDERSALKGTDIEGMYTAYTNGAGADEVERIGKDQAEEEYHKTIEPLLKVSPGVYLAPSSLQLKCRPILNSLLLGRRTSVSILSIYKVPGSSLDHSPSHSLALIPPLPRPDRNPITSTRTRTTTTTMRTRRKRKKRRSR